MSALTTLLDRVQGKAPAGARRSPKWTAHRRAFMADHRDCASCQRDSKEAHHVLPFHIAPDLELEADNLIALCARCHLFVGHLGNYQLVNLSVREDAAYWRARMAAAR